MVKTLICSLDGGFLGSGVQYHCCHKWRHFSFVRQQTLSQHATICKTKWNQCKKGARDRAAVRVLTSHKRCPVSNPGIDTIMWVEFVVGSLLCSDRFFSRYSSSFLNLSSKTKIPNLIRNGRQGITLFIEVLHAQCMWNRTMYVPLSVDVLARTSTDLKELSDTWQMHRWSSHTS